MPLFGDRGRVSSGGREKNERVGPPTDPSSPSTTLKTETRTSNPSIFHLPLHTFFHPPLAFMDRGEDDTSAEVQFPSPVTTPRPSRNRNEAGPARAAPPLPRVLRHHYLKLKLVPRVHPRGPRGPRRGGNRWKLLGACYWRGWVDLCMALSLSLCLCLSSVLYVGWIFDGIKRLDLVYTGILGGG